MLLFFPNLPIRVDDDGRPSWSSGPTTKLMAWLFGNLRKEVERGSLVLGVETHAMRRALEALIRMRVVYLPHPVEFPAEVRRRGGEGDLTTEDTEGSEDQFVQKQGGAWTSQAGAEFSKPSASELARDSENTSLTRSASGPDSSSVSISENRGENLGMSKPATYSAKALEARASLADTIVPQPSTLAEQIVFGCYGAARWEKGSDVLQAAIRKVLEANPDIPAKFCFQWLGDFTNETGEFVRLDPWLKNHSKVQVITEHFKDGGYAVQLARTSGMILPYRSPYRLRVSRVVIEAMINGIPVIAPKGTTLFEQAEEFGEVVDCEDGSAESLAHAILDLSRRYYEIRERAIRRVDAVAQSFSVGYFRDLLRNSNS